MMLDSGSVRVLDELIFNASRCVSSSQVITRKCWVHPYTIPYRHDSILNVISPQWSILNVLDRILSPTVDDHSFILDERNTDLFILVITSIDETM
jgi:hypothetical protein